VGTDIVCEVCDIVCEVCCLLPGDGGTRGGFVGVELQVLPGGSWAGEQVHDCCGPDVSPDQVVDVSQPYSARAKAACAQYSARKHRLRAKAAGHGAHSHHSRQQW